MSIEDLLDMYPLKTSDPVGQDTQTGHEAVVPARQEQRPLNKWQDSWRLKALSEFLQEYSRFGCRFVEYQGRPTLHFSPGLHPWQTERWQFAEFILDLIDDAREDIESLWRRGLLPLPRR